MKSLGTSSTLFAASLLLFNTVTSAKADSYAPRVGQRHPDLTLPRIDTRQAVSLSQFRGKKVLLIHFASW